MWDEDTSDERMAISASLADPYLAILRDDSTLLLLQADDSGDLDEVLLSEDVTKRKWLSCCLYCDNAGVFSSTGPALEDRHPRNNILLFLLSSDCKLFVSQLGFGQGFSWRRIVLIASNENR